MSVDTHLLGETTAECMDSIDADYGSEDGELVAVGIIAVIEQDDQTFTRIYTSRRTYFEQLGLYSAALECVRTGDRPDDD